MSSRFPKTVPPDHTVFLFLVVDKTKQHIAATVRLSIQHLQSGVYADLIAISLFDICHDNPILLSVYEALIPSLKISGLVASFVYGTSSPQTFADINLSFQSPYKLASDCLHYIHKSESISAGVLTESVKWAYMVAVDVCNFAGDINEEIPSDLGFLRLPEGKRFWLLPSKLSEAEYLSPLGPLFERTLGQDSRYGKLVRAIISDPDLLNHVATTLMYKALKIDPAQCLSMISAAAASDLSSLLLPLTGALKALQQDKLHIDLSSIGNSLRLYLAANPAGHELDAPCRLCLLELTGISEMDLYISSYQDLNLSSYLSYVYLFSSEEIARECATVNNSVSYEESLLLLQKWDIRDLEPAFRPDSMDGQNFLHMKDIYDGRLSADFLLGRSPSLDPVQNICSESLLTKLGAAQEGSLSKSISLGLTCKDTDYKKLGMALQGCAKWHGDNMTVTSADALLQATAAWKRGDKDKSILLLNRACANIRPRKDSIESSLYVKISYKAAKYNWEMRSRPLTAIRQEFLEGLPLKEIPSKLAAKVFHLMGRFMDEQYQKLNSSESIATRRKLIIQSQRELENMKHVAQRATPRDPESFAKGIKQLESQLKQDVSELEQLLNDREQHALKASSNYLRALVMDSKYDLVIFRLCALWFTYKRSAQFNTVASHPSLPSYKFIPLVYQLAARLDSNESESDDASNTPQGDVFQKSLQSILTRLLQEHPHHCLYQILALRASGSTSMSSPGTKRRLVSTASHQDRRAAAASHLIVKAKATNARLETLISDMERLCSAYSELALVELRPDTPTKVAHPFEARWSIRKIKDLQAAMPTTQITVSPSGRYEGIVTVQSFAAEGYRVVGGINMPKIVECLGSDGLHYRQLVKGKDDVRQVSI